MDSETIQLAEEKFRNARIAEYLHIESLKGLPKTYEDHVKTESLGAVAMQAWRELQAAGGEL